MAHIALFATTCAWSSYGDASSIRTLGKATCTKSGDEYRISMRSFGEKPVPCDVIYKRSEDTFKKLNVVVDSKTDPAVCSGKFAEFQKTLQGEGYTCTTSLAPSSVKEKAAVKEKAIVKEKSAVIVNPSPTIAKPATKASPNKPPSKSVSPVKPPAPPPPPKDVPAAREDSLAPPPPPPDAPVKKKAVPTPPPPPPPH